jgi:oxygen-dependent protoporphyrinogen oxidase
LSTAVVGSGAAGLAAAFRLREAGNRVRLLERNDRLGGKMLTTRREGFTLEEGPSAMAGSYTSILGIARQAGMADEIVPASGRIAFAGTSGQDWNYLDPTHIVRDGLRTKLLTPASKLRLARLAVDVFRTRDRRRPDDLSLLTELDGVTADQYARERLGDEVAEYLVDPCVRSFVNCTAQEISAADLIYALGAFMGSSQYVAFRNGMSSYADRIGAGCDVSTGAEVLQVSELDDHVDLTWRDDAGEQTEAFAGVVLACDAHTSGRIHTGLDPWRREFLTDGVTYTWSTVAHLALEQAPDVDSCFVFPRGSDHPNLVIISLEHNKTPWQAPPGKGLVGIYPSSAHANELYEADDDYIVKDLIGEAEELIPGLGDHIRFTHVSRWSPTLLQSRPGYWTSMREFTVRGEAQDRRIQFAGDYFCTSSLNTASASGERGARRLLEAL